MAYTKVQIQQYVAGDLSALATDAGYTYTDFENSVTYALIIVVGADDATLVTDANLLTVIAWAKFFAYEKLNNYYSTAVDFKLGPREENLSQIARAISSIKSTLGMSSNGPIVYQDITWTFNDFTTSGISNWPINWFDVDWDNRW